MTALATTPGLVYAGGVALLWGCFLFYVKRHFADYPPALVIAVTNVWSVAWFLGVVAVAPASVASPIISLQAVAAVVLGGLLLGEDGLALRLAAAGSAVAGVALIAVG